VHVLNKSRSGTEGISLGQLKAESTGIGRVQKEESGKLLIGWQVDSFAFPFHLSA